MARRAVFLQVLGAMLAALLCGGAAEAGAVRMRGNVARSMFKLDFTRRAAADKVLDLRIYFALRDRPALDQLLADQQDPNSPQYHRWLTPDEFATRFGPSETDFSAAMGWLKAQNVSIKSADIKSRQIRFADTVAHAEQMFGTPIFSSDDGRWFGIADEPAIPARFEGVFAFIDGLDNLRAVFPASRGNPTQERSGAREPSLPPMQLAEFISGDLSAVDRTQPDFNYADRNAFGPADLRTFYDETPLLKEGIDGSGSDCIAFLELSDYADKAITAFDQKFSLPDPVVTKVFPDTTSSGAGSGSLLEEEVILDLQWAHATAPGVPLKVYIGDPTTVGFVTATVDAGQAAINDNSCGVIDVSLTSCGTPESFFPGVAGTQAAQAASQGMSVFVSSGDYGAAAQGSDSTHLCAPDYARGVNEIAASPNVTGVGGTQASPTFNSAGNDVGFVSEQVWNDSFGASGGGASKAYAKPAYQKGLTPADGARDVPDVAALASGLKPGYWEGRIDGEILCCGYGTSYGAPIWAGFITVLDQIEGARLGNINPRLYRLGPREDQANVGLRDVTVGNNSFFGIYGYKARPLYDQTTGWGSPDVANFAKAFLALPPTPLPSRSATPSPAPTPAPTAAPTGAPTPTGPVQTQTPTPTPAPSPTATAVPSPISGTGIAYGSFDGFTADEVNPSGANGALGLANFVLKTNNQIVIYDRSGNVVGSPIDDTTFFAPIKTVGIPRSGNAQNGSAVANQGRVYYDPDGPTVRGCAPGGRWLIVELGTAGSAATPDQNGNSPAPGTPGILIASSPGSDPTVPPSQWYQAFLPADCSGKDCADSPQLGWNVDNIAIVLNNYYNNGKWHPGLLSVSHLALECGQTFAQPALGFQVLANDPKVTATPQPAWDTALQGACPAQTYTTAVPSAPGGYDVDFEQAFLPLISVPNNSTSQVEISELAYSGSTSTSTLNANMATIKAPSPWAAPPQSFAQNGSSTNVTFSPGDARFTSCMVRGGALWAAQTVGLPGSSGALAGQWWEIGLFDNLTFGQVYAFNQIGGGDLIAQNVVNPSIAANANCPRYGGKGPTCDVMVGFTAIPASSTSGFMSSGYVLTPNNASQQGAATFYDGGQGLGAYQSCPKGIQTSIPTGSYSATTIDPSSYPGDRSFFTTEQFAGVSQTFSKPACSGYEWATSWALLPN